MEKEIEISFIELIKVLNSESVRYLIIGRRAVILYGGPVMTADYDLWIHPGDKKKTLTILESLDMELSQPVDTRRPMVTAFSGSRKLDLFFHKSITNFRGDVINFDECYAAAETAEDPDAAVSFRIPAIKDLIKMKQIREPNAKDGQDIEFLLKAEQLSKKKK